MSFSFYLMVESVRRVAIKWEMPVDRSSRTFGITLIPLQPVGKHFLDRKQNWGEILPMLSLHAISILSPLFSILALSSYHSSILFLIRLSSSGTLLFLIVSFLTTSLSSRLASHTNPKLSPFHPNAATGSKSYNKIVLSYSSNRGADFGS